MNAAVVSSYDAPPRFGAFEEPVAGEGEVLVNVSVAGLHPIVKSLANGSHYGSAGVFPFVPGVDGVGQLADGRRVLFGAARSPFGTFAERTVASGAMCLALPDGLEDIVAAGLANPAMS
jgi:NADPH:quinone reductase-like Zn-dependent oxidoreductase